MILQNILLACSVLVLAYVLILASRLSPITDSIFELLYIVRLHTRLLEARRLAVLATYRHLHFYEPKELNQHNQCTLIRENQPKQIAGLRIVEVRGVHTPAMASPSKVVTFYLPCRMLLGVILNLPQDCRVRFDQGCSICTRPFCHHRVGTVPHVQCNLESSDHLGYSREQRVLPESLVWKYCW